MQAQHSGTPLLRTAPPWRAGVGLKPEHIPEILETHPDVGFFEIHAENYMGAGGAPHRNLAMIRERYPLSLHGVGLSIGSEGPLDREHLGRLRTLNTKYDPELFSEHLAWSTHDQIYVNDLLPVAYNVDTLVRVCDHIDEVQETVGRKMLLENPSTYVAFEQSSMTETAFLKEVVRRTGCGLLLDVNNVYVSCINHDRQPEHYLQDFPIEAVGEVHLGGHAPDMDQAERPLLIDAHDREVDAEVWRLYEQILRKIGPIPTLVEWDNDVPAWGVLLAEAERATGLLKLAAQPDMTYAV
ncbi:hypothetical protein JM93_03618 [Roseibium hamelinense]|uniref:UPF0276 protein JM93_03618 n=1 Tax=Roseibium hamelinense TaxID=150831 RepID=A0A562SM56_9HYPH|nr:DUF692 domain-containing protein [Roseibium hamelinense]MTI45005.1 DUF692 domain-containing protein [Roseibium hamelinense]TWI82268.1 hypothetical protein JM93_03618 [Roseibium hamelinense]